MDDDRVYDITAYLPNGKNLHFSCLYKTFNLFKIGFIYQPYSYMSESANGMVQVAEVSEDYKEVWLEYYNVG